MPNNVRPSPQNFLEMLRQNPNGWGNFPPSTTFDRNGNPIGEIRNPSNDTPVTGGLSGPATLAYHLSGIPLAMAGIKSAREGSLSGNLVKTAAGVGQTALAALPMVSPAVRAAYATLPRAVAMGSAYGIVPSVAAGTFMAEPAEAGSKKKSEKKAALRPAVVEDVPAADDGLSDEQRQRRAKLMFKMNDIGRLPRAERTELEGINAVSAGYAQEKNKAKTDAEAVTLREAATRDANRIADAEAVKKKMLDDAPKPFADRFPNWSAVQPFIPGVVGGITGAFLGGRGAAAAKGQAERWWSAVRAGEGAQTPRALTEAAARAKAFSLQTPKPTFGNQVMPYAVPVGIGAVEGAVATNIPDGYNSFLPSVNPERAAYEEYLKRVPPGSKEALQAKSVLDSLPKTTPARDAAMDYFASPAFPRRTLTGAFEGGGAAILPYTIGSKMGPVEKNLPRAETEALQTMVSPSGAATMEPALAYILKAKAAEAATSSSRPITQRASRALSRDGAGSSVSAGTAGSYPAGPPSSSSISPGISPGTATGLPGGLQTSGSSVVAPLTSAQKSKVKAAFLQEAERSGKFGELNASTVRHGLGDKVPAQAVDRYLDDLREFAAASGKKTGKGLADFLRRADNTGLAKFAVPAIVGAEGLNYLEDARRTQ